MKIKQRGILAVAGITTAAVCVVGSNAVAADTGTDTAKAAVSAPAISAKTDGENIFRGLFFSQGKVGKDLSRLDLFSEARQHLDNESADEKRASDAVIKLINKKSPGFFADFSKKSRSGDPRKVERAVSEAQATLLSVAKEDKSAMPVENGQRCGVTVAVGAAVVHVAAVVTAAGAVVTVTVAVGANFVKGKNWFWSAQPTGGDGTQLSKDEAVAQVTKALKAA
ncbi:sporulation delaying protein family toxin [Streptomyces sp. NBC_01381]|uniref:sporulation delaying protein family toxin n=1 Tax=Streptomyces sp. NBC_01381 TaxID=2903845 RepID=UPI0022576912|nr:sporulation delaying protein family toxin [Streptomyces sp. NBC_01381]MCX4671195.1 sporulation delaying protein family toxin [Streptomyces sp. NBC_01381]